MGQSRAAYIVQMKDAIMIDDHCARTIHAEMNAILQCSKFGVPTDGAEIYVTHYPCIQCCKSIIQAGIKTVYYAEGLQNTSVCAVNYLNRRV